MNPAQIGGLLQGGGAVLGALGLGGSKFKSWHGREQIRQTIRQTELMPAAVRKGAEEAGFNPLTVLGQTSIGGAAAGGTLTPPKLASLDMMLGGLKGISDEFTGVASQERARQELQLDLAKIELEKAKALQGSSIQPAPRSVLGGPTLGARSQKAVATINGRPVSVDRNDQRTGTTAMGIDVTPALGTSDAEDFEKRYGDIVSAGAGVLTLAADAGKTARVGVENLRTKLREHGKNYKFRLPKLGNGPSTINHGNTRRWSN